MDAVARVRTLLYFLFIVSNRVMFLQKTLMTEWTMQLKAIETLARELNVKNGKLALAYWMDQWETMLLQHLAETESATTVKNKRDDLRAHFSNWKGVATSTTCSVAIACRALSARIQTLERSFITASIDAEIMREAMKDFVYSDSAVQEMEVLVSPFWWPQSTEIISTLSTEQDQDENAGASSDSSTSSDDQSPLRKKARKGFTLPVSNDCGTIWQREKDGECECYWPNSALMCSHCLVDYNVCQLMCTESFCLSCIEEESGDLICTSCSKCHVHCTCHDGPCNLCLYEAFGVSKEREVYNIATKQCDMCCLCKYHCNCESYGRPW